MNIPSGNLTFLFTDIEDSTKLSQEFPETLQTALDIHHSIMKQAIEFNSGFVFEIIGDAFCSVFKNADDAINAAVAVQKSLSKEKWNDAVIKVRMGIHSGNAEWNGKRYMGYITLARTARVMSVAYGEQILISNDAYELSNEIRVGSDGNEISFRDLGERRLKDVIQSIRLFQILSPGLRQDFPPLKTLDARPNNLPVQLTSFIGREAEMTLVRDLLKQTRLLTLTGSGGAGKTRLALQVAADLIDDFANGVSFVELASLFEPVLLPHAIMKVFGLKEEPKRSLEDLLCDYLKDKEILIIFDNCEHLVEHCAKLAEKLLSNCPKLKIIATSREALRCSGEQTHRILSLDTPDTKEELSHEKLIQYEAVRLFIERALAVNKNFRINNDNAPALAQICYQLDGIPLAIELAAARIKVLTVEKIFERLNDRFKLLTGGKRTALPRQQTLRALIDWSYDLLTEEEKKIWRKLSVFSGGWTLEAAKEVCADDKIKKEDVLELLDQLTEKSIIIYEIEKERYRILESLKQYGEEKLNESNESFELLSKYLNYFMEFSETAEKNLMLGEALLWLEKLEKDHLNFQSAIEWSIRGGDIEKGIQTAMMLGRFWLIRGHYATGRRLLENIQGKAKEFSKFSLGKVYVSNGNLALTQGEFEQAKKYFEDSLAIFRGTGDKLFISNSLNGIGSISYFCGNYEEAQKIYEESLEINREIGNKNGIAAALNNIGNVLNNLGRYAQAQEIYKESLSLFREIGDKSRITLPLHNLGLIAENLGDYQQALTYYEESLMLNRAKGDKRGTANTLQNMGLIAYNRGNYTQSQKIYEECLTLYREIGDKSGIAFSIYSFGIISSSQENYERAQNLFEESMTIYRETGEKSGIASTLDGFGTLSYHRGNYEQSQKYYEECLEIRRGMGDKSGTALTLNSLGNVSCLQGNYEQAQKYIEESLALNNELGNKWGRAVFLIIFAGSLIAGNNLSLAVMLLGAAEASLKNISRVLEKPDQKFREKIINDLREKLNDEEFLKYFEEGKKLTLEQAVNLALSSSK